jgi:hypothetical protein
MSYADATAQLRSAMIEHLIGSKPVDPVRSMLRKASLIEVSLRQSR